MLELTTVLTALFTLIVTLGLSWIFHPAITAASDKINWSQEQLGDKTQDDDPLLSIVIPAYNEEDRISIMLSSAHEYMTSDKGKALMKSLQTHSTVSGLNVEWIIVNDGSKDDTNGIVRKYYKDHVASNKDKSTWKILNLDSNSGKGAAVQTGMMAANGHFQLMVDADGATEFGPGLEKVVERLVETDAPVVFGSRAHLQNEAATRRGSVRTLLMYGFHICVSLLVSSEIKDTQCGFKLFTRDAATRTFSKLHLRRWAFDTELLVLCSLLDIGVQEVDVPWHEVDGSKLHTSKLALALVSLSMLRDMICVRACYTLRIWKAR